MSESEEDMPFGVFRERNTELVPYKKSPKASSSRKSRITSSDSEDDLSNSDCDESEVCAICLGRIRGKIGSPDAVGCDHYFCLLCILEWAKNNASCPQDRRFFNKIIVRKKIGGVILEKLPIEAKKENDPFAYIEENPTFCEYCGSCEREDCLLLCDGCDLGYHLECLTPPLSEVPIEEWFCPNCVAADLPQVINNTVAEQEAESKQRDEAERTKRVNDEISRRTVKNKIGTRRIPRTRETERILQRITRKRKKAKKKKDKKKKRKAKFDNDDYSPTNSHPSAPSVKKAKPFGRIGDDDIDAAFNDDEIADKLLNSSLEERVKSALSTSQIFNNKTSAPSANYTGRSWHPKVHESTNQVPDILSNILVNQNVLLSKSSDVIISNNRALSLKEDSGQMDFSSVDNCTSTIMAIPLPSQKKKAEETSASKKGRSKSPDSDYSRNRSRSSKTEYSSKHRSDEGYKRKSKERGYKDRSTQRGSRGGHYRDSRDSRRSRSKDRRRTSRYQSRSRSRDRRKNRRNSRSRSPKRRKSRSRSPKRRISRSKSPKRRNSRSPKRKISKSPRRRVSRSPRRRISKSPRRKRTKSPSRKRISRSASRKASRSPSRKRVSKSPKKRRSSRYSQSPNRKKSLSNSPKKRRSSRYSQSPNRKKSLSNSPRRKRSASPRKRVSRSRSPQEIRRGAKRQNSESKSPEKNHKSKSSWNDDSFITLSENSIEVLTTPRDVDHTMRCPLSSASESPKTPPLVLSPPKKKSFFKNTFMENKDNSPPPPPMERPSIKMLTDAFIKSNLPTSVSPSEEAYNPESPNETCQSESPKKNTFMDLFGDDEPNSPQKGDDSPYDPCSLGFDSPVSPSSDYDPTKVNNDSPYDPALAGMDSPQFRPKSGVGDSPYDPASAGLEDSPYDPDFTVANSSSPYDPDCATGINSSSPYDPGCATGINFSSPYDPDCATGANSSSPYDPDGALDSSPIDAVSPVESNCSPYSHLFASVAPATPERPSKTNDVPVRSDENHKSRTPPSETKKNKKKKDNFIPEDSSLFVGAFESFESPVKTPSGVDSEEVIRTKLKKIDENINRESGNTLVYERLFNHDKFISPLSTSGSKPQQENNVKKETKKEEVGIKIKEIKKSDLNTMIVKKPELNFDEIGLKRHPNKTEHIKKVVAATVVTTEETKVSLTKTEKLELEAKVVKEANKYLYPYYQDKCFTKQTYKEIMEKIVRKVLERERSMSIKAEKIQKLVDGYVQLHLHKLKKKNKHH